jgi:hypothetical protein
MSRFSSCRSSSVKRHSVTRCASSGRDEANDYTTSLTGLKFKIAHKRAGSDEWSATPRTQRKRMITFLQEVIADLEKQNVNLGGVTSPQRKPPAAGARRKVRARQAIAKPARVRGGKRSAPRRAVQRATRLHQSRG